MKWINTKVEFAWDSKEKRYKEIDVEGYHYSGPIADCGGGGCFLANTKILMTDGDVKNIEDIKVGDMVQSYDVKSTSIVKSKVTETFVHNDKQYMVINGVIKTTSIHPFYCNEEWVEAGNLSVGDKILHVDGLEHTIKTIEKSDTLSTVYNFEVGGTHNYFAEGYLVHNKGPSLGSGEAVMVSGSGNTITSQSQASLSVGDDVLSAKILGLPDTDVISEYLLWEYTGSDITTQVTLATSSVESIGESSASMWTSIQADNGRSNPLSITPNHTVLAYSGSSTSEEQGAWYFEYAGDVVPGMKFLSSSMEVIDVTSANWASSSESQSFYRSDIEPYDVYFVDGILIHN
tara:strand:+ start:316 stop:1353 length:1038 start_codon:yes stop_codon:yes gene_type:complete